PDLARGAGAWRARRSLSLSLPADARGAATAGRADDRRLCIRPGGDPCSTPVPAAGGATEAPHSYGGPAEPPRDAPRTRSREALRGRLRGRRRLARAAAEDRDGSRRPER